MRKIICDNQQIPLYTTEHIFVCDAYRREYYTFTIEHFKRDELKRKISDTLTILNHIY